MKETTNEWKKERTNEWMNAMNKGKKEQINEWMNKWMEERTNEWMNVNEWMSAWNLAVCITVTHTDPCWTCKKYKSLLPTKPLYSEA